MVQSPDFMRLSKENSLWNAELTQKAQYFRRLLPLLEIERIQFRDDKVKLFNHYPKIEIVLKIIDIILDHTSIIADTPFTGISQAQIFTELRKFLIDIDKHYKKNLTKFEQKTFFSRLWEAIVPQAKRTHLMEGVDMARIPFKNYDEPFYYLQMERTPDGEILYSIDPLLINIYAKILDIRLEDQQEALKYILTKKINEGNYSQALTIAKKDMEITIQYLISIQKIKSVIQRSFSTKKIYPQYRNQLKEAREHIGVCRRQSKEQYDSIQNILLQEVLIQPKALLEIKELRSIIEKSMEKLISIQEMIQSTRENFLNSQSDLFGYSDTVMNTSILSQINRMVLESPIDMKDDLLGELLPFFSIPKCPHIESFSQIINIKMKRISPDPSNSKKARKRKGSSKKLTNQELIYDEDVRLEAINLLNENVNYPEFTPIVDLFSLFDTKNVPNLIQDYIRLKIQISFADPSRRIGKKRDSFQLDVILPDSNIESLFQSNYFQGVNLLVRKKIKIKDA